MILVNGFLIVGNHFCCWPSVIESCDYVFIKTFIFTAHCRWSFVLDSSDGRLHFGELRQIYVLEVLITYLTLYE